MGCKSKTGFIDMKQTGLIQRVIEAIVLYNGILKGEFIPSDQRSLVKYYNVEPPCEMFIYSSVVGVILVQI